MSGDPHYALGVLRGIVYKLATEPGDVKERLFAAFTPSCTVFESDLPEELREEWKWIHTKLLERRDNSTRYAITANLYGMHKKTAARIAVRIWDLWSCLSQMCAESR